MEKSLKFTDLYVQMTGEEESNERNYCWGYEIEDGEIYIETPVFANYRIAEDTPRWNYHDEYEWIGAVRTQVLFDGENISFGDAVFTPK